ncbi:MAG: histidine ammonia-lyase [Candidatus Bathyarchaeia archaeon]
MHKVQIDGENLTIEDVVEVAYERARVSIPENVKVKVEKSRKVLEKLLEKGEIVYGVNTGFGALSNTVIPKEKIKQLQTNLIRSHAAGVGKPLGKDVVRATMLLRANTLAKGYSGVRPIIIETLVEMLNRGVHPIIPAKGSVGASGDLAPLSHMALVLMGEGEAEYMGEILNGGEAMEKAGLKPVQLDYKEGIALNNGTQLMTAIAALNIHKAENLIKAAEVAAALSMEALLGVAEALDEKIHKVRPHNGQITTAKNIRELIAGSRLVRTSKEVLADAGRPHDPYSLRCTPQVLGAAKDALAYARRIVETEINSATDNPLIFPDEGVCLSGGNFHGQPISLAMDMLGIALAMVGNLSEKRIARLLDEKLSNGLPAFLIPPQTEKGLHSGLMTAQYTAAALASENKILAHPACVDSIPTSANFEDFVSMGTTAAQKASQILENTEYIVAIELLCAAQAIDIRGPEKLGKGTRKIYTKIRSLVPMIKEDKVIGKDIEKIRQTIQNGTLLEKRD